MVNTYGVLLGFVPLSKEYMSRLIIRRSGPRGRSRLRCLQLFSSVGCARIKWWELLFLTHNDNTYKSTWLLVQFLHSAVSRVGDIRCSLISPGKVFVVLLVLYLEASCGFG